MLKKIALGAALVALVGCDLSRRPKHPHTETPAAKKEEPKIPKAPYEVRFTEMGFEIASTSGLYPRFSHYVSSFGKICTLNLEGVAIKDLDCDDRTDNMAINGKEYSGADFIEVKHNAETIYKDFLLEMNVAAVRKGWDDWRSPKYLDKYLR